MKLARWFAILASCAVVLPALGSLKNPIERPMRLLGYGTYIVDLVDGSLLLVNGGGTATHAGIFTNEGAGNFFTGELSGVATAANGDQLFWEATGPNSLIFVGGTGRFEGSSGGFSWTNTDEVITVDDETMTMTVSVTYVAQGTVTF